MEWTVKNYGMGVTAYDSWYDKVYLSRNDQLGWYPTENYEKILYIYQSIKYLKCLIADSHNGTVETK